VNPFSAAFDGTYDMKELVDMLVEAKARDNGCGRVDVILRLLFKEFRDYIGYGYNNEGIYKALFNTWLCKQPGRAFEKQHINKGD